MRRVTLRFARGEAAGLAFGPEGPPDLVFLHATGFNAMTYRSLLAPLGADYRVLAVDQRGHGRSRLPADPRRLDTWRIYVRDLLALLRVLPRGAKPPVFAGHSMGGAAALTAAAARPGVADRLVLIDPVLPPLLAVRRLQRIGDQRSRIDLLPIATGAQRRRARFTDRDQAAMAYRGRGAFATWSGRFLADYVEDGCVPVPYDGVALACAPEWEAASFAALRHFAAPLLRRVRRPVAIIRGERGSAVRVSDEQLRRYKPDVAIELVPGTTHFVPMEQPALVQDRLRAALAARAQEP